MKRWCGLVALAVTLWGPPAAGQPLKGVVWAVPADARQAEVDLRVMRDRGVEAIRTGLITDEAVLTLADTLGFRLFLELPLEALPAPALLDTLAHARRLVDTVAALARRHPSIRHLGLTRRSDTSDPAACAFFEPLAARAHDAGLEVYYVGFFPHRDRCRDRVDFVLWDALDGPAPVIPDGDGLARLGTWMDPAAPPGRRIPHSAEAQARFLEDALDAWLSDPGLRVLFVHRWRDVGPSVPGGAPERPDPYGRRYGLLAVDGTPRPAFEVMAGFYTGRQRVFAFPAGTPPATGTPGWVLLGWGILLTLAGYYARSPRLRFMVPRYFLAHGFYREAVRQGRDVLPVASALLLVMLSLCTGMLGTVLAGAFATDATVLLFLNKLPGGARETVTSLLARPWLLLLSVGSLYALGVALWALMLGGLSRRTRALRPAQVLMLVVWPRWGFLLVMAGTMVATTLADRVWALLALAAAWLLITLWATGRTLVDYARVTRTGAGWVLLASALNPLWLLALAMAVLTILSPEARFFWHAVGL